VTTTQPAEGTPLVYQCALPLSRQTLTFAADLLRARLKKIGSRWRKLPPGKIALIVLATLRHDHRLADMAGGNGISASTISRWTWEIIALLAARAPRLDRALAKIKNEGGEAVLLDGTLIPTRRRSGTANRRNYNGKHKKHGLLFLALTDQAGNLTWISCARRGAASEITAARHDNLAGHLRAAGLGALADLGFTGLDPTPKTRSSSPATNPLRPARPPPPSARPTRPCPPPAPSSNTASATSRTGGSSPASASAPAKPPPCYAPCSSSPASTPPADRRS
jgi:DDE superfamily endonuclease